MMIVRLTRAGTEARVKDGDWHTTLRRQGDTWPCTCHQATAGLECVHQLAVAEAETRHAAEVAEYRRWLRERRAA